MQPATNVIQLSDYIPRKPADRYAGCQLYRCRDCGNEITLIERVSHIVLCGGVWRNGCDAEMRPVEAK